MKKLKILIKGILLFLLGIIIFPLIGLIGGLLSFIALVFFSIQGIWDILFKGDFLDEFEEVLENDF